ncbi:Copia protein, partial [Mucuna pruriens]
MVYIHALEIDLSINGDDPVSFSQAVSCDNSENFSNIVELLEGCNRVGFKWVFKTKYDSHGNLEYYKARLVAKDFTQKNDIDYKDTFCSISRKDSFRIFIALIAHYDMELHQINVKTFFLNGDLKDNVYMD